MCFTLIWPVFLLTSISATTATVPDAATPRPVTTIAFDWFDAAGRARQFEIFATVFRTWIGRWFAAAEMFWILNAIGSIFATYASSSIITSAGKLVGEPGERSGAVLR